MKSFILSILLIVSLLPPVSGQTEANATEERGPHFRVTSMGKWAGPELFVRIKDKWQPLELLDMAYSAPMPFSRQEPVAFARKGTAGDEYVPVLSVSIPKDCLSPMILMQASKDGKIQHHLSDIDPANFPYGSYKLVNFTRFPLAAQFGDKRFSLGPAGVQLVSPDPGKTAPYPILIREGQDKEKWKTVYSNMVINRPSKRMFLFLYPVDDGSGTSTANVRCLVDFRQDE